MLTMKLLFLQLSSISCLKLLQMDYPTTPYKAAGDNTHMNCLKLEAWAVKETEHKCAATQSNDQANVKHSLEMAAGSACVTEMDAVMKEFKTTEALGVAANTNKVFTKAQIIMDRCCMQRGSTGTGATTDTTWVGTTDALGNGRLAGIEGWECKGWSLQMDSADDGTMTGAYEFYSAAIVDTNIGAPGGCKAIAATGTKSAYNILHKKTTSTSLPASIAAKETAAAGGPMETLEAAADACDPNSDSHCTTNALIEAARKQCSKVGAGWWNADYTALSKSIEIPKAEIVCGGFCTEDDSSTVTFFPANTCFLTTGESPGDWVCYSSLGLSPASADMPKAFNDPKVVNLAGEAFEILETGTFSMLHVSAASNKLLQVDATIDRAGSVCGATYIQNVTLSGTWVSDIGHNKVEVRANAAVPKKQALQISTDGEENWKSPSELKLRNSTVVGPVQMSLTLHAIELNFAVDSHRIVEGSKKTRRFANFLNMNLKGVRDLASSLKIGGLLSTDSHDEVSQLPADCKKQDMQFISRAAHHAGPEACPIEKCGVKLPSP